MSGVSGVQSGMSAYKVINSESAGGQRWKPTIIADEDKAGPMVLFTTHLARAEARFNHVLNHVDT